MATSQHYMVKADGSKRYLSCNPELAMQHNWNTAVDRLAASLDMHEIRRQMLAVQAQARSHLYLHPETATRLGLDLTTGPLVSIVDSVPTDACDSDTAYKGAQWALSITLAGLVGLAAWAILSL